MERNNTHEDIESSPPPGGHRGADIFRRVGRHYRRGGCPDPVGHRRVAGSSQRSRPDPLPFDRSDQAEWKDHGLQRLRRHAGFRHLARSAHESESVPDPLRGVGARARGRRLVRADRAHRQPLAVRRVAKRLDLAKRPEDRRQKKNTLSRESGCALQLHCAHFDLAAQQQRRLPRRQRVAALGIPGRGLEGGQP